MNDNATDARWRVKDVEHQGCRIRVPVGCRPAPENARPTQMAAFYGRLSAVMGWDRLLLDQSTCMAA